MSSKQILPNDWEVVIGLEVHAQLSSSSKLFSGATSKFGLSPNEQVSFIDSAMPGMLPFVNRVCVDLAIMSAHALCGSVSLHSVFERKHYFYADLPQGYQISQLKEPLMRGGKVSIALEGESSRDISIERMHMEQDAGKSLHGMIAGRTCVDLNRSGVGLLEIVSQPELRSSEEASAYVSKLRSILMSIGACDGNMQDGSLRVDANVSVRRASAPLGTRCEIKNLNSLRFLRQAISYEARRQHEIICGGGEIEQETRLFDSVKGITRGMRSKEEAHDYRYFPDPDIPPLSLSESYVEGLRAKLPELPDARISRLVSSYALPAYTAGLLSEDKYLSDYFEELASKAEGLSSKDVANWLLVELSFYLRERDVSLSALVSEYNLGSARTGELLSLIGNGKISARAGKEVLAQMLEQPDTSPASLVAELGLERLGDRADLLPILEGLLRDNESQVASYRSGKSAVFGWFVGQAMSLTKGRADPKIVGELLRELLSG